MGFFLNLKRSFLARIMRNRHLLLICLVCLFGFLLTSQAVAQEADTNAAKVEAATGNLGNTQASTNDPGVPTTKNLAVLSPKEFVFGTIQFLCMALIVYFLMVINPSKTKQEEHTQFIDNLKKNDEVLTSSGFYGKVFSITPEQINLEISPNVRVRFDPKHIHPLPKPASNAK